MDDDQLSKRSGLVEELETLIAEFEAATLTLPPSESMVRQWTHRALSLGKQIRSSDLNGKSRQLRRLQRFQWQIRQIRVARRRYLSQRDLISPSGNGAALWADQSVGLRRHRLADAIHSLVDSVVPEIEKTLLPPLIDELASDTQAAEGTETYLSATLARPRKRRSRSDRPIPLATVAVGAPAAFVSAIPIGRAVRPGATRVDPIMVIEGRLALAGKFEQARETAIAWLAKKGMRVAPEAWDGFEVESKDKKNKAIAVAWNRMWALQVETVDAHIAERRWRVEMVLVDAEPTAAVGVRLTAISSAHDAPPPPSIPGLVSALIQNIGLLDAEVNEQLFAGATAVETPRALRELLASLQSANRRRPAIVMSRYQKGEQNATLMDPASLAERLRGVARVYVLSREMSWGMTGALTKRFSVAGASIRLFRPGFTLDDDPSLHPYWDPAALKAQDLKLADLTTIFLREATDASIQALGREDSVPPFDRIREQVLKKQIEEARQLARAAAAEARSETEIVAVQQQLRDESALRALFEEENVEFTRELQSLRVERDSLRDECQKLKAVNHHLRNRNSLPSESPSVEHEPEFPEDWDNLEEWCQKHVEPEVQVTSKAVKAARDSVFVDVPFVYKVLYFLAKFYVPSRRGELSSEQVDQEKSRLGVVISPVGRGAEDRKSKPTYSTTYRNERLVLDLHVKGSDDVDPRYGFRLYFHWHDEEQCVVVGWFPSHLRNRLTN